MWHAVVRLPGQPSNAAEVVCIINSTICVTIQVPVYNTVVMGEKKCTQIHLEHFRAVSPSNNGKRDPPFVCPFKPWGKCEVQRWSFFYPPLLLTEAPPWIHRAVGKGILAGAGFVATERRRRGEESTSYGKKGTLTVHHLWDWLGWFSHVGCLLTGIISSLNKVYTSLGINMV